LIMQMMEKDRILRPTVQVVLQRLEEIIADQTKQATVYGNENLFS
jgi:hypothetical protein